MRRRKKELSDAQFAEQLKKHRFEPTGMVFPYYRDLDFPNSNYPAVVDIESCEILKRATMASLKKARKRTAAFYAKREAARGTN